jgi:hypothetical protein
VRKWVIIVPADGFPVIFGKVNPVYLVALITLNSRMLQPYTWPQT